VRRTPLRARTASGIGRRIRRLKNRLSEAVGDENGHPVRLKPATFKQRVKLKKVGRRGIRLEVERKKWRERIYAIHGERCLYPGCKSAGPFEVMHAYSKGAHPEWHVADWNGFPGCVWHHRLARENFEFTPYLKRALQWCADEMRAAAENRRPQPTWEELQAIIAECIRKHREEG